MWGLFLALLLGLVVGAGLASLVLIEAWLLLGPTTASALPPTVPPPSPSPIAPGSLISISTTDSTVKFSLPDGAVVYLAGGSDLELTHLADTPGGGADTLLTLYRGKVLVFVTLRPNHTFFVQTPTGARAQVTGSALGVTFDPETQQVAVDCLEGHCALDDDDEQTAALEIPAGQSAIVEPGGTPVAVPASHNDQWEQMSGVAIPTPTEAAPTSPPGETATPPPAGGATEAPTSQGEAATPAEATSAAPDVVTATSAGASTPTGIPTVAPAATATPPRGRTATPRPATTPTPNIAATRASFCATFQAQFPSTPCP